MLEKGVVERSVGEACCREVLQRSVLEKWRGVVERSVGKKCYREVLEERTEWRTGVNTRVKLLHTHVLLFCE